MKVRLAWIVAAAAAAAVLAALAAAYMGGPSASAGAERFVVLINPGVSQRVSVAEAQELEAFLEGQLGVDVELRYPTSTAALVEALKFKHAHAALGVGSLAAAIALREADVEMPLVEYRQVIIGNSTAVAPYYYSYFIVLRESPYVTLDELRGRRACFPSETSVSGFIMPMRLLAEKGYVNASGQAPRELPRQFFGEVLFGGGYAQCWEALKKGQVDVTVMAGDVAASLYWDAMNRSRVLKLRDGAPATAGPNPSHVVLLRRDLPEDLKRRAVEALLALNGRPDLMRKFVSAIFVEFRPRSPQEHLGPLAEALDRLGLRRHHLR